MYKLQQTNKYDYRELFFYKQYDYRELVYFHLLNTSKGHLLYDSAKHSNYNFWLIPTSFFLYMTVNNV